MKPKPKSGKSNPKPVWGLTGGIASGKSLTASFFAEENWTVIDADRIARELGTPGGAAHEAIIKRFGTADRAKLREIVFSDPTARRDLEGILHPLIQIESQKRMDAATGPVLYEATLLIETGRYRDFDGLIVVVSPLGGRIQRLIQRDGSNRALAEKIIAAQISDDERRAKATYVLENNGDEASLRKKVHALSTKIVSGI